MLSLERIRAAVTSVVQEPVKFVPEPRHAAVAMILADGDGELEACFIRRAERAGDPWSGQVAFPGGRAEPGDSDAAAVAERETWEEVGLSIASHQRLGPLPTQAISRHGRAMTLSPFVYHVERDGVGLVAQDIAEPKETREVTSVFWVPLSHLFDVSTTTLLQYPQNGAMTSFPGIRFGEHVIWGLTLKVLGTFAELMRLPLPALEGDD